MKIPDRLLQAAAIGSSGTPLVVQTEAAECGLACLAMIAGRYGYRVDLPALRQRYDVSLRGTTLHDVVRVAANLGWRPRAARRTAPSAAASTAVHPALGPRSFCRADPGERPAYGYPRPRCRP